jgi:hypothetical protein
LISRPGKGIGLHLVTQEKVVVGLVGVGLLGVLFHDNETRKDGLGLIEEGILVEKVRAAVRRDVRLQGALIE